MSHFSKLSKVNITNPDAFVAACEELGIKTKRNTTAVCYRGSQKIQNAEVVANMCDGDDMALVKNSTGTYDLMYDSYMGRHFPLVQNGSFPSARALSDRLVQLTTKHTIINTYRAKGFRASVREDENKNLNVILERY